MGFKAGRLAQPVYPVVGEGNTKASGILLATQSRWSLAEFSAALDRALSETDDKDWRGRVRWLNDFRPR